MQPVTEIFDGPTVDTTMDFTRLLVAGPGFMEENIFDALRQESLRYPSDGDKEASHKSCFS